MTANPKPAAADFSWWQWAIIIGMVTVGAFGGAGGALDWRAMHHFK